jgi:PIN domain nuclease of toxin-antitoxin system
LILKKLKFGYPELGLPINLNHIYAIELLPFHHQDPFDRLLVAQALVENMFLVTADSKLKSYMDKIIW